MTKSMLDRKPSNAPDFALMGAAVALSLHTATPIVAWSLFGLFGISRTVYIARWWWRHGRSR